MKNDIKYIIKRIIIGIGITFGVMLVKSLPVFADELQNYYINYDEDFFNSSSYLFSLKKTQTNNSSIVDSFTLYDKYKVNLTMDNNFGYNGYYYLLYNKSSDEYIMQYFAKQDKLNFDYTYGLVYGQNSAETPFHIVKGNLYVYYNSDFKNLDNPLNLKNYTFKTDYGYLGTDDLGLSFYKAYKFTNNNNNLSMNEYDSYIYENDWEIVSTNIKTNIYKQLNQIVSKFYTYDTTPSVPTGYEKIDMFNKYSIVFYAKDFRKLEKICSEYVDGVETDEDGNVTVIPNKKCSLEQYNLLFYYNGDFNTSFANLENMTYVDYPYDQLPFNPDVDFKYDLPLKINTSEFGGAIIFYNNSLSQNTDDEGNVTTYYDKGYIYYNADLFDYYFVDDYNSDVDENISYIDSDGNEHNVNIKSHPGKFDTLDNTNYTKNFSTSFMEKTLDTFTFIKSNLSYFFNSIPDYFYYFIITILIIYVAFIFLRR